MSTEALDTLLQQSPGRWPGIDPEALRRQLEAGLRGRSLAPELLADLALCCACLLGHRGALEELDELLRREVGRAVRPLNAALVDEATQQVRERLLIPGADGRVRLADYHADGSLAAWLRAIAIRTALNLQRGAVPDAVALEDEADLPLAASDPELELLRARHREAFRAAFAAAMETLSPRDRAVLRLHTLEGMTLARIGAMYRKDTSTVSRWLEQIRRALREATCDELGRRLSLGPAELESMLRAADAEVSVSLARLLAD